MRTYHQLEPRRLADGAQTGAWWEPSESADRIDCLLCPRKCSLKPGDRGFCFVRENRDGEMVLSTYGKSTGFCIDPIEKKPLNHFFPGTPVLSFGTAGCNLGCKFCQNWDISKSREVQRLSARAEPLTIAQAARQTGCQSVAFTYNDPVIWAEYAMDTARACREMDIKSVAVTAGYICPEAREEFFACMDAANVDLKAFTEEFYQKITYSHLQPVLETLQYLKRETSVWFEITNLIIPDVNDSSGELRKMCNWILSAIGDQVPVHFTAFHPDFRMTDRPRTDAETLEAAYEIAKSEGLKYVYVGNVHDVDRQSTFCHDCGQLLIERNWYQLGAYHVDTQGRCVHCQTRVPGRFGTTCGDWGTKRQPIRIEQYADSQEHAQNAPERLVQSHPSVYALKEVHVTSANPDTAGSTATKPNPVAAKPLKIDSLTEKQRQDILQAAADWLAQAVLGRPMQPPEEALADVASSVVMGAFVTLRRGEVLRGCCGVLGKPMPLGSAIQAAAARTAKEDQRMAPISPIELPYLDIDVTLLGPFNKVTAEGAERAQAIQLGKHGLMIQQGQKSGLLLPSVATERGWDVNRFLQGVCAKAGLPIGAWQNSDAELLTFDGEAIEGKLSDRLPSDLPTRIESPLTEEQLAAYAQLAGQNIVAIATGGTPSYVVPQLPDLNVHAIVLSMQWGAEGDQADKRQANAMQVSFRPGVALQSTLYQMCQRAASMFQQQQFAGQLQVGLSIGFDPSMHGYGAQGDLAGVDTRQRAVVISDPRHCGLAFDPERTADALRDDLRSRLPIGSRDAALHTLHMMSTMPAINCVSIPSAVSAEGTRPPAVAGKFYPAEDAARRAMVGTLFKDADWKDAEAERFSPLAIMVPHAGLKYSGKVAAKVWQSLDLDDDRTILVISPKHTHDGVNWSVCPFDSWRLSSTTSFAADTGLAKQIADRVTSLELDAAAHQQEHGIEVQLPILEKLSPEAKVVGVALHGGSRTDIEQAATEMADLIKSLDKPPLMVISSDMNHYAPDEENRRRDRLALDALATGDPQHLIDTCSDHEISMCGLVPAAFVLETLRQLGQEFKVVEVDYATSADVSGDKSRVVGYAGALLLAT